MKREVRDFTVSDDPFNEIPVIDLLDLHMADVSKTPALNIEQEKIEIAKINLGKLSWQQLNLMRNSGQVIDTETKVGLENLVAEGILARDHFIRANTGLVVTIAKSFTGRGVELLDLIQDGYPALIKAVDKFDSSKGNKFSTYATRIIRRELRITVYAKSKSIKEGTERRMRPVFYNIRKFFKENGREPSIDELVQLTGLRKNTVLRYLRLAEEPLSLDAPTDTDGLPLEDLGDPQAIEQFEAFLPLSTLEMEYLLSKLNYKERKIIEMRLGIGNFKESHTLEQIGTEFKLTRERIRQIEAKALGNLRFWVLKDIWK